MEIVQDGPIYLKADSRAFVYTSGYHSQFLDLLLRLSNWAMIEH